MPGQPSSPSSRHSPSSRVPASACPRTRSGVARLASSSRAVRWISRWSSVSPKSMATPPPSAAAGRARAQRVLEQPAPGGLADQVVELLAQAHLQREAEARALVHERRQGHLPAVADAADHELVGDPGLLDEELVELRLAGDLAQRAH